STGTGAIGRCADGGAVSCVFGNVADAAMADFSSVSCVNRRCAPSVCPLDAAEAAGGAVTVGAALAAVDDASIAGAVAAGTES
ncbi:hypothetical protein, partial [Salmonella sp. 1202_ZJSL19Sal_0414]|uniref:hypothetical protein n=1 Tax=Salmonella sp. 1202_ZJSL19Sal_0414 TaxID=3159626 RepID=UPI00397AA045